MDKKNLIEQIKKEQNKLGRDVSIWDAFLSLTKDVQPPYITTLIADIDILKDVARGYSAHTVAKKYNIHFTSVEEVCFTWGMVALLKDLDFDPLVFYHTGETFDNFMYDIGMISPYPIDIEILRIIFDNVQRYLFLKEIYDEHYC